MKQFGNDERAMIEFIRHRIQHLSDHLHHNDWAEIAPNEMAVLGDDDEDAYTREWTQRVLNIPKEREEEKEEAAKSEERPTEETQGSRNWRFLLIFSFKFNFLSYEQIQMFEHW